MTNWRSQVTIIIFSAIAIALASFGDLFLLGELYAFGALTAYLIASMALVKLRFSEPDLARPFQVPFNIEWKGKKLPILCILGTIGCMIMLFLVASLHEQGRNFAFLWFAVGIVYFFIYRNYRKNQTASETTSLA